MFFSIIIPVYNIEKYINQCVDSVINQGFTDIEIILVDDGSTDGCSRICDDYAQLDSRIKVIHKINGGLSDARNAGISEASGKYVWFVDGDDWIAENALQILYKSIQSIEYEIVGFTFTKFDHEQREYSNPYSSQVISMTNGKDFMLKSNLFFPSAWTYIYKNTFLKDNKLTFKVGQLHEDDYFNLSCFDKINTIIKLPDSLYFYRIRAGSITSSIEVKNIESRINSYINLIDLTHSLKNLDSEFLNECTQIYQNELYNMCNLFFTSNLKIKDKFKKIKSIKDHTSLTNISSANLNLKSKLEYLLKKVYNKNLYIYFILVNTLFFAKRHLKL